MLRTRAFIQHGKGLDDPREVKLAHNPQVLTFTLVLTLLPKPSSRYHTQKGKDSLPDFTRTLL